MIENIIDQWCKTGKITINDIAPIISELAKKKKIDMTPEQLQQIINLSMQVPVNWDSILTDIALDKGYNICTVISKTGTIINSFKY